MPSNQGQVPEEVRERFWAMLEKANAMWSADFPDAPMDALESVLPHLRKQFAEELAGEFEERAAGEATLYEAAAREKDSDGKLVHAVSRDTFREAIVLTRKWATDDRGRP